MGRKTIDKYHLLEKVLAVGIIFFFVATSINPTIAQKIEKPSLLISKGNTLDVGESKHDSDHDVQAAKNLTYMGMNEYAYTEQSPSPPSEWDGIYEKYTLMSQEADIHYDRESQDGSTNLSNYAMKYKLKDRDFDTYYEDSHCIQYHCDSLFLLV